MQIQILLPRRAQGGNRATATRYLRLLEDLGHEVSVHDQLVEEAPDLLIAIHARKCHAALVDFRSRHPARPLVLVLAGTDIYPEPCAEALDSMRIADRLVALQARALQQVPARFHSKTRTIIQSATPDPGERSNPDPNPEGRSDPDHFQICVVGHLRAIKDPLRAAAAARLLRTGSRITIRHAGRILEPQFGPLVEEEQATNPRYEYLGELTASAARALIARSRLQVLSSLAEGGAQVLGESIVSGTPVLASRHDAALSLLGDDYPGLFDLGATEELASLMAKAEGDPRFLAGLVDRTRALAPQFAPERERRAWRDLLSELYPDPKGTMPSGDAHPA